MEYDNHWAIGSLRRDVFDLIDGFIAMYLRISDDDNDIGEKKKESSSISNQRKVLWEYIKSNTVLANYSVREFLDDGYSGVNLRRPGVQKLLKEVQEGNVACIIVKDLSRFGRNYIEVGDYIEQIFPFLGVRFIAVSDHFDSFENSGGIEVGFKNLIHDLYSKDLSKKIKSVKWMQQEKGAYCGGDVPYGYVYSGNKETEAAKDIYIPDQEAAQIVKRIFNMAANGKKVSEIAKSLNEEGISTPGIYKNRTTKQNYRILNEKSNLWTSAHIREIIQDEVYIGTYVCRKSTTVRPRESVQNEQSEYLRFEDAHKRLVTKEIYEAAQKVIQTNGKRGRYKKGENAHVLQGKVKCGYCGYSMNYNSRTANKNYACRMGKSCGSQLRIIADELEQAVLEAALEMIPSSRQVDNGGNDGSCQNYLDSKKLREEQRILEMRAEHYKTSRMISYQRWKDGYITKEKYIEEKNESVQQESECITELNKLEQKLAQFAKQEKIVSSSRPEHLRNVQTLTKEMVGELIERIDVYGADKIEIVWKEGVKKGSEKQGEMQQEGGKECAV